MASHIWPDRDHGLYFAAYTTAVHRPGMKFSHGDGVGWFLSAGAFGRAFGIGWIP